MKQSVVSERYAQALFDLAQEKNEVEKIREDLKGVVKVIKESDDFKTLLQHPIVNKTDKKEMFDKVFKGKISETSGKFLNLLLDKNRENYIEEISDAYDNLFNKLHSKVVAKIFTALELENKELVLLRKKLETYLDKQVEMETYVDEKIMGGVLVKVGDRVIDGTLKTRFENMARVLK